MKFSIGKYNFETDKNINDIDTAVKFVQKRYPELGKELIERYIKPILNADKSRNIPKKDKESGEINAKIDSGGAEKSETRKGK